MIVDGAQIRAGRALIGWHQRELAAAAQIHWNTVSALEKQERLSPEKRRKCHYALEAIRHALEAEGVRLITHPVVGVGFAL
jgi:transcriptional regulator with XRE-family HTH domain